MQISAYITHKNLAVCNIMEAMRTVYAQSGTWSQHASNYAWGKWSRKARKYCERKARLVLWTTFYIAESLDEPGGNEMHHSYMYFTSLVRISNICTQISHPLDYGLYASHQKLVRLLKMSKKLHCKSLSSIYFFQKQKQFNYSYYNFSSLIKQWGN